MAVIPSYRLQRYGMLSVIVAISAWWHCHPALAAFDQSHAALTRQLERFVEGRQVRYREWQNNRQGLDDYLKSLAEISPSEYESFNRNQKKALWINAYNALAIKIVLDHYPISGKKSYFPANSIRQIPDVWESFHTEVAGRRVCLYSLEHDIIRREFHDPRMHFAVVCASKGCPAIVKQAYSGEELEEQLESARKRFFSNTNNLQLLPEKHTIRVSHLFKWFPLDFAKAAGMTGASFPPPSDDEIIAAYVLANVHADNKESFKQKKTKVEYLPYDWSLNDAAD